ncbi:hypothetical protein BGW38_004060, partial [Lunasporangiospora selenospora]
MTIKEILSRCSLEKHENETHRHQRAIRMESLSEEDVGVVFWEDFCDLHGWPRTPTMANIHRYIEVFVNEKERKINRRRGLAKGDGGYLSGYDLFIKPVLRQKARLIAAQNAAAKPAVMVRALPEQIESSAGSDSSCTTTNSFHRNINNKRPISELETDSHGSTNDCDGEFACGGEECIDGDNHEYSDDDNYEYKKAAFVAASCTSKKNRLDIFAIPEIAWLISRFLGEVDLRRLCQTSKGLLHAFHSILWRHYVLEEDGELTEELGRSLVHLRSLDLNVYLLDFRPFKFFGQCDSLTRLHVCAFENSYGGNDESFYDSYDKKEYLDPLISTLGRQHYLTQLELNTRLVLHYPDTFLSAFLALQQLRQLRIYMTTKMPTIPTALKMVVDLLNRHPRVEAICFGDWYCIEDSDDEFGDDSYDDHSQYSDDYEREIYDEIGDEEADTFKELEHQLRATGYPMITKLELPPRQCHSYPAAFLEPLFRSGLPNLQSLRLPEAETSPARDLGLAIRSGCPKLKHLAFTPETSNCVNVLENCSTLSSISVKGASITNGQLFCRHADTLTVLILPCFTRFSSAALHQILLQCSALKVLRLENGPPGYSRDYQDVDFKTGRWSCTGLEVLWLFDCITFGSRTAKSPPYGYVDYKESRRHFWTQVGHLSKLQELEIG